MANDAPDFVTRVQVAVTVANVPTVPEVGTEVAAGASGRYSGTEQTYQSVAKWTVSADKVGELKEILIISDDYDLTKLKVTIAGVGEPDDWLLQAAMPLIYEDLKLAAGDEVEVQVQSTDGTAIIVDALIVGKEIG